MKNRSKLFLAIGIILIFIIIYQVNGTYARYISAKKDGVTGELSKWNIKVNDQDILKNGSITLDEAVIEVDDESVSSSDKFFADNIFAPGRFGYFEITIDYEDVSVPFEYDIQAEMTNRKNNNIIEYIKIIGDETEEEIKNDVRNLKDSPLDINNPLKGKLNLPTKTDDETTEQNSNKKMTIRVYTIWKEVSSTEVSESSENSEDAGKIKYQVTLKFNQITDLTEEPEEPEIINYLKINNRKSIEDLNGTGFIDIGDKITLNGEEFYVTKTTDILNNQSVTMIAAYNLNIGDNRIRSDDRLIQNKKCYGFTIGYEGYSRSYCTTKYYSYTTNSRRPGDLMFERDLDNIYQSDAINEGSTSNALIKNEIVKDYVEEYEEYLNNSLNIQSIIANVPSQEDVENILTHEKYQSTFMKWFEGYSFWTRTTSFEHSDQRTNIFGFKLDYDIENFHQIPLEKWMLVSTSYDNSNYFGVRPIITIPAADIVDSIEENESDS